MFCSFVWLLAERSWACWGIHNGGRGRHCTPHNLPLSLSQLSDCHAVSYCGIYLNSLMHRWPAARSNPATFPWTTSRYMESLSRLETSPMYYGWPSLCDAVFLEYGHVTSSTIFQASFSNTKSPEHVYFFSTSPQHAEHYCSQYYCPIGGKSSSVNKLTFHVIAWKCGWWRQFYCFYNSRCCLRTGRAATPLNVSTA